MKKLIIFSIIFIFCVTLSFALDCQYTYLETFQKEEIHWFEGDNDLGIGIIIYDVNTENFRLMNHFDFTVNVSVTWGSTKYGPQRGINTELSPEEIYHYHFENEGMITSTLKYGLKSHPSIGTRIINVDDSREACKQCPLESGILCLDDGKYCTISNQCGGKFCVREKCNNKPICYGGECFCSENEFQCPDASNCVIKKSVPLGSKPVCDEKECVSLHVNPKTGRCSLRDGESCKINDDCDSSSCIRNICSSSLVCYNNDCNCAYDEIQNPDNTECVKKDVINIGSIPLSGLVEECVVQTYNTLFSDMTLIMKYIDPDTGKCAIHPDIVLQQKKDEILINGIIIVAICIVIFIGFFVIIKKLHEKDKAIKKLKIEILDKKERTLIKEIQAIEIRLKQAKIITQEVIDAEKKYNELNVKKHKTEKEVKELTEQKKEYGDVVSRMKKEFDEIRYELQSKRQEVHKMEKRRDELKRRKKKTKKEENELVSKEKLLINAKNDIEKREKDFEKTSHKFYIKEALDKYAQEYNQKIYFDKNSGYIKFKDSHKSVHRNLYTNNISNNINNMQIHHIDRFTLNNEFWNLIALTEAEHDKIKHSKIPFKDWDEGIVQLKQRLNKTDKDFHKYILERMKKKKI